MLCSMFLKASVVRVRNPVWSQRPQKSLETLPVLESAKLGLSQG